jgi:hypothetical protein
MARGFSDELWCVQKNGLWGYVDSADKVIVDFQYIDATSFRDGIAFVRTSRMNIFAWGLIDKQGRYLIISSLSLSITDSDYRKHPIKGGLLFMEDKENHKGIAFDYHGNAAFTFSTLFMTPYPAGTHKEGYYVMQSSKREPITQFFLVDKKGEIILSPGFRGITPSKEGIIQVTENHLDGLIILTR